MEKKEVYLRDYVKVLIRHLWVVILVPVVSVLTTAVFVFGFSKPKPQPKVYEGVVIIQNGSIQEPIMEKAESFEMIKIFASKLGEEIKLEDINNADYFKIKFKGEDPDKVKEICEKIAEQYISSANVLYNRKYQVYRKKLDICTQRRQILEEEISELQGEISNLSKMKEVDKIDKFNSKMMAKQRIVDRQIRKLDIENRISDINLLLADFKQFTIVESAKIIDITTYKKINKKKKILLSFIIGLLGGVLLAFTIENWSMPKGEGK